MQCYLDNSATTKPCKAAVDAANHAMTEAFGNPSSLHACGFTALQILETARGEVAKALSADSAEIYFTPSGTAANNTAIFGAVGKTGRNGGKIVTTAFEHPSVENCMRRLEEQGFTVIRLLPDASGNITAEQFQNAIDEQTVLVSTMAVNNEVGSILPFDKIAGILRRKKSKALLHVDAVQGFMKLPIVPKKCGIDLLSVSAHKIHGLKGAGALYVRQGLHIKPYLLGGGQENGLVSGTQATPAIAAFGAATKAAGDIRKNSERVSALRDRLVNGLRQIEGIRINSPENALPYIVNISVAGIPSQVSVNYLSTLGVSVSAGSACAKGHRSPVLTAMGLSPAEIDTAVRISLSRETTQAEIDTCINAITTEVQTLRKKG
ncbi:MAG: cysteine desulfurase family protein [Candidatus Fimenecus sp.]